MQVTARDIERIPPGNLRVPRDEFAAVWTEAERISNQISAGRRRGDHYVVGVLVTCRWLATAVVPSILGGVRPAYAPVTGRTAAAHEELIEYEAGAAERACARYAGRSDAVAIEAAAALATLRWAWRGVGDPPLDMRHADAG